MIKVFKTAEEWLDARKTFVGASEVGAILGVNPYCTALQIYLEKIGEADPKEENEPMAWGKKLEGEILQEFFRRNPHFDYNPQEPGTIIIDDERPYMAVTPDYWDGSLGIEAKNTRLDIQEKDDIPRYWFAQVQYQMLIAGASSWFLVALCQGQRWVSFRIEADLEWQRSLSAQVEAFWGMVQRREPPVAQDGDVQTITWMYPPVDDAVTADESMELIAAAFQDAHAREVAAKKEKDAAKAQLIQASNGASMIVGNGWKASYKTVSRAAYQVKESSYEKFDMRRVTK